MWNGKQKAVTLSYDDGVIQDIRLISILDRYGLKGTFNLNTDLFDRPGRIPQRDLTKVYAGHEVAGHTCSHSHLEALEDGQVQEEISRCQDTLSQWFGRPIFGLAYPYGVCDERIQAAARKAGVAYGRTTLATLAPLSLQRVKEGLLELPTTCRHREPGLLELAREFVALKADTPQIFYLWGHSYEFDHQDNWDLMEEFCRIISGHEDIFYGTNCEVLLGKKQR